ncbi:kelch-like protein 23 [Paramacrobiotus metropolitanus]|uniref:kelch-like protein 23 n=1 Tax=Paramacrobiotus metropolitanus TaxID=2943436 RepID=UPI0024463257|nr:kelch-like protein 23 [Paramacrobiotus metropolitanus]
MSLDELSLPENDKTYVDLTKDFFGQLRDVQMAGHLCDVVLKGCEDTCTGIPCHRLVLCACSSYFRSMFTSDWRESPPTGIQLNNIQSNTLQELVRYAYSMEITINEENVYPVLTAALFLDISSVSKLCWRFVENHMTITNCLTVYCLADLHNNPQLASSTFYPN